MDNLNLNLNNSDCLQEVYNLFNTVYVNVCTGRHTIVPLGTLNIIGRIIGILIMGPLFILLILFIVNILINVSWRGGEKK